MEYLILGQKIKLLDISNSNQLHIGLSIVTKSQIILDISCFGVDAQNKLSDDRYFIFYNQKSSPCGSLLSLGARNSDNEQFYIDFLKLPSNIRKLVFVATIDGNGTMSQINNGYLRLCNQSSELARFSFAGSDFKDEKAIIIGEIYFKDVWRFSAVGQGFNGGLSALLKYFGGEEITNSTQRSSTNNNSETIQQEQKVIKIITLEKQGDKSKINLKKNISTNQLLAKLTWTDAVDLDLHAFVITKTGEFNHIYFGCKGNTKQSPYIQLDKDAGVGAVGGDNEENITVAKVDDIQILVFAAHIFKFLPSNDNFSRYDGKVVVTSNSGDVITVKMTSKEKGRWCLIAGIRNDANEVHIFNINRVEQKEPNKDFIRSIV